MSPAPKDYDATKWVLSNEQYYSVEVKRQVENYNTRLGYIYATSNVNQMKKSFCLDWALIACRSDCHENPNKVSQYKKLTL